MDERVTQFRIGVMVLATFIVLVILMVMFGRGSRLLQATKTVHVAVHAAPGVTKDTPVRKSGVLIGRVSSVDLQADGSVVISLNVDSDQPVLKSEVCRIDSKLLGDAELNFFLPRNVPAGTEFLEDGDVIPGIVAADPMDVVGDLQGSLSEAIDSVAATSRDLGEVVRQVGHLLEANEQRINAIVVKAEQTLDTVRDTAGNANSVIGDPQVKAQLAEAIGEIPQILRETRQTVTRMNETIALVDRNLQNMEGFTRPLGERGQFMVARLEQGVEKLDKMMDQMVAFSTALNNSNGTLGRMVNDPELYDNLNRAVSEIEAISRDIRPILSDARTFSDRIARHPEVLGLGGAMQRSPGTKGVPSLLTPR